MPRVGTSEGTVTDGCLSLWIGFTLALGVLLMALVDRQEAKTQPDGCLLCR